MAFLGRGENLTSRSRRYSIEVHEGRREGGKEGRREGGKEGRREQV
jgi:hypothetical protein